MTLGNVVLVGALVMLGTASGCRRAAPDAPPAVPGTPATLEVLKSGRWLFTYVEPEGQFATTDKPETVPAPSRAMVRVFDPSDPSSKTAGAGQVYTTNLNELLSAGKTQARALSREAFETAALAQLPPGVSSSLAARPAGSAPAAAPLAVAPGDAGAPGTAPVVTLYGTSWCGACRTARQYFKDKNVSFLDKDIEMDPAAKQELIDKASKLGIPYDRVPVIDVRGRLLLGFDRARIETLLGEST